MTEVCFFDPEFEPPGELIYSVVAARHYGKWIFVRKCNSDTYELAAGHIEKGETSFDAAQRELMEETGASDFNLKCVNTYMVKTEDGEGYGRLFFAEIMGIEPFSGTEEICEVILTETIPEKLTYPFIQSHLFARIKDFLAGKNIP
jgi:8-oxo-dGTP diphosphatase